MTTQPTESGAEPDDVPPTGRVILLLLIVGAWAVITVGIAFEQAEMTHVYQSLTLFVAILVSRYWGLPARLLTGAR
jgi:hypothetical protein